MIDITKYTFRLIHILTGSFIIGNSFADIIFDQRDEDGYVLIRFICLVFLLISGVVNLIILRPSQIFDEVSLKT